MLKEAPEYGDSVTLARVSALSWRRASSADIGALQHFRCCPEPKPVFGARRRDARRTPEWQRDVQSAVRDLRPDRKSTCILGLDGSRLAAVVAYSASWADRFVFLQIIAVSLGLRGQRIGDNAMREFSDDVTSEALSRGVDSVRLEAKCSPENDASLKLFGRWNWQYTGQTDDRYQIMESDLIIEGGFEQGEEP